MLRSCFLFPALAAIISPAFAAEWLTDWKTAAARAAEQQKVVLADFTGSDWCYACIQLRKQVLDTPAFEDYARDKFVLLEVDVPKKAEIDPALLERNKAFCARYNVEAFPTLMLLTPEGGVLGGMLGSRPTVAAVEAELEKALANAARLAEAESLQGEAQVRALYAIYEGMPREIRLASGLRERIAALDATGITPLPAELEAERQMADFHRRMKEAGRDLAKERRTVEEALANALPANRRVLLEMHYQLLIWTAECEADVLAARDDMLELLGHGSPDREARRREVEEAFADPDAVLQQWRAARGKR